MMQKTQPEQLGVFIYMQAISVSSARIESRWEINGNEYISGFLMALL